VCKTSVVYIYLYKHIYIVWFAIKIIKNSVNIVIDLFIVIVIAVIIRCTTESITISFNPISDSTDKYNG